MTDIDNRSDKCALLFRLLAADSWPTMTGSEISASINRVPRKKGVTVVHYVNRGPSMFQTHTRIASQIFLKRTRSRPGISACFQIYDSDNMCADVTVFGSIVVRVRSNSAFILFFFST